MENNFHCGYPPEEQLQGMKFDYLYKKLSMDTLEIKKELQYYIETGNDKLVERLYKTAKALYEEQLELDRMIEEGEEDIRSGRVHSMDEVEKMMKEWRK